MESSVDMVASKQSNINEQSEKVIEISNRHPNSESNRNESEEINGEPLVVCSSCEENADKEAEQDPLADKRPGQLRKSQDELNRSLNIVDESLYPKDENEEENNLGLNNVMVIVNDHDPMDLLTPLRSNHTNKDDSDEESGAINTEPMTKEQLWKLWMTKYEWLLHEEGEGDLAYCLYCDVTVHIGSVKYIKQHALSLYHQEREDNFLAFQAKEKQLRGKITIVEIKQEFGTDSRVAALKYQRAAQSEPLNNFNWSRWLKGHDWLVREHDEGTIGYCKYCRVRLNIEFTYLRKRHETSKGHREAERIYKRRESKQKNREQPERTKKRMCSDCEDGVEEDEDEVVGSQEADDDGDQGDDESNTNEMSFETIIPSTNLSTCTLCEIKLTKTNFNRHTRTKTHLQNLQVYTAKKKSIKKESTGNNYFSKYAKQHPWLTSDPNDPECGYCTVCNKRFMFGHSEARRRVHEVSAPHKAAAGLPLNGEDDQASNDEEGEEDESDSEGTTNQDSDVVDEQDLEDEAEEEIINVTQKRLPRYKRGSKEWFANKDYPWCKPHRSDPNYIMCVYCNIALTLMAKRKVHSQTLRHIAAEAEWRKKHKNIKKGSYHPWLRYTGNKKIQFCKYCRVRFPNEPSKARHGHSQRHKDALKKYSLKYKQKASHSQNDETEERAINTPIVTEAASSTQQATQAEKTTKNSMHAMVLQWKSRFPWLSYKRSEHRQNYGWCKVCEVSFFVPSYKFASKHHRSGRHIRARLVLKRSSESGHFTKEPSAPDMEKPRETIEEMQAKYIWFQPDEDEKYCRCRVCDVRLPKKVLYLRQHDISKRHLENKRLQAGSTTNANSVSATETTDNDLIQVDGDGEENHVALVEDTALNDAITIKSESGDDVVECIVESTQNETLTESHEPLAKRPKLTVDASGSPALDASQRILETVRQLQTGSKRRNENSPLDLAEGILSSSLSIAACFAPLMQQSLNQSQNQPETMPKSNSKVNQSFDDIPSTTLPKRIITDLFFESVSETMKHLPSDLVAEGKMKIMQVMFELELRALKRNDKQVDTQTVSGSKENRTISNNQTDILMNGHTTVESSTVNANEIRSTQPATLLQTLLSPSPPTILVNDDSTTVNGEDDIVFVSRQSPKPTAVPQTVDTANNKQNQTTKQIPTLSAQIRPMFLANCSTTIVASHNKEGSAMAATSRVNDTAVRRPTLPTIQVNNRAEAGTVRCVPLNTLTKHSTPVQCDPTANLQKGDHNVSNNSPTTTTGLSGNNTGFRQIRLNTSTQTKFITIQPSSATDAPMRLGNSTSVTPHVRINSDPQQTRPLSK